VWTREKNNDKKSLRNYWKHLVVVPNLVFNCKSSTKVVVEEQIIEPDVRTRMQKLPYSHLKNHMKARNYQQKVEFYRFS
jgi:hypothetical protein